MAKPRTPNQKKTYAELNKRLSKYMLGVMSIYEKHNFEASLLVGLTDYTGANGEPFSFDNYPQIKDAVSRLKTGFATDLNALIYSGTSAEWMNSNKVQDLLADDVLRAYHGIQNKELFTSYYQNNSEQLKAFQERRDNGMNLSQKIWNQAENYKQGLEASISTALEKGMSAVILSKKVSKYLLDWESLKKDYKERFGTAVDIHDCEYRSMRLARSEINMAYRTAEQIRWQQMDFIVGKEIKLSGSHPQHDICDMLAGKYPKDFKWTGWHPNDLCYEIPILNTEDEFWSLSDKPSVNTITDVPQAMKDWLALNAERVQLAKVRGTLPYWIRDNKEIVSPIYNDAIQKNSIYSMLFNDGEKLVPSKIVDFDIVKNKLLPILSSKKEWFNGGFNDIIPVSVDKSYMSTDINGNIKVNFAKSKTGFNAGESLVSAIKKLNNNDSELLPNEEYAIEALWHEILHNKSKNKTILPQINDIHNGFKRVSLETCHQLYARHTYSELCKELNYKPRHSKWILENGFGYQSTTENLRFLLKTSKINESLFISKIEPILMKDYSTFETDISNILRKLYKGRGDIYKCYKMIELDTFKELYNMFL